MNKGNHEDMKKHAQQRAQHSQIRAKPSPARPPEPNPTPNPAQRAQHSPARPAQPNPRPTCFGSGILRIPMDELGDLQSRVPLVKETKPELVIPCQGLIPQTFLVVKFWFAFFLRGSLLK